MTTEGRAELRTVLDFPSQGATYRTSSELRNLRWSSELTQPQSTLLPRVFDAAATAAKRWLGAPALLGIDPLAPRRLEGRHLCIKRLCIGRDPRVSPSMSSPYID